MKLDVIVVDWEATIGQPILAVDLIESYVWTNGKRTDVQDGWTLTVLVPQMKFDKLNIKIKTKKKPQIFEKNEDGPVPVRLTGLTGRLYQDYRNNEIRCSLTADEVEVCEEE